MLFGFDGDWILRDLDFEVLVGNVGVVGFRWILGGLSEGDEGVILVVGGKVSGGLYGKGR